MKTRRILAASTAALLAFGTTAAYVASAAANAVAVTVTVGANGTATVVDSGDNDLTGGSATIDVSSDKETITITPTPNEGYMVNRVTVTIGGTAASVTNTDGVYTAEVAKDTDAAVDVNVTFKAIPALTLEATLDSDGEWVDFEKKANGNPAAASTFGADIAYQMTASALDKNEGWGLKVTNVSGSLGSANAMRDKDNGTLKGISSTAAKSVWKEYDEENKLIVLDFSVVEPDDDDFVAVNAKKLNAPVTLRVSGTGWEIKHVYHLDGGKLVELDGDQVKIAENDGRNYGIEFTTKSFSPYVFSKNAIKGAVAADDSANPETSGNTSAATSNGSATTNPDTGIALAIAPVVLAAGAVAVVALKKKH